MKYIMLLFLIIFSLTINAQEIEKNGKTYEVKNEKIFLNGEEITKTLSQENKNAIFKDAAIASEQKKLKAKKEAKKLEKKKNKALKAEKRAKREAKKAKKALKKKLKSQAHFNKANKNLKAAQKKYDKLKSKGKLTPNDDVKWLDKIEKLRNNIAKAKKKM